MENNSTESGSLHIVAIIAGHYWITTASLVIALPDAAALFPPLILIAAIVLSAVPSIITVLAPDRVAGITSMVFSAACGIFISVGLHDIPIVSPIAAAAVIVIVQSVAAALGPLALAGIHANGRRRALMLSLPIAWFTTALLFALLSTPVSNTYYATGDRMLSLLGSSDMQIRWEAADTLGRTDPQRAVDIAISDSNPHHRRGAVLAIALAAQNKSMSTEDAIAVILILLKTDDDKWVKMEALRGLEMLPHNMPEMLCRELVAITDSDPTVDRKIKDIFGNICVN